MSFNFGSEMNTKLKNAIKLRLSEFNAYVDDELPDYVLVMLANRRTKETMLNDLKLFLGSNTIPFIDWLHELLERLQQPSAQSSSLDTDPEKPGSRRIDKKGKRKGESSGDGKRRSSDSKPSLNPVNVDVAIDRDEFAEELDRFKQSELIKGPPLKLEDNRDQRHLRQSEKSSSKSSHERSPSSSQLPRDISMSEQDSSSRIREARVAPMISSEPGSHHMESVVKLPSRPRLGLGTYALIQKALREATADSQQISAARQLGRSRLGEEKVVVAEKMDVDSSLTITEREKLVKSTTSSPTKRKGTDLPSGTSDSSHTTFVVTMNATPSDIENKKISETDMSTSVVRALRDRHGLRTIVVEKNVEKERLLSDKSGDDKLSLDVSPVRKRLRKSTSSDPSADFDEIDQLEELSNAKLEPCSIKERCKFWPMCRNDRSCPYLHPTEPCKTFPNCVFGNKCYYIHPPCRYQAHCTNDQCPFLHTTYRSPYPTYPYSRPYGRGTYSRPPFSPRVFGPTALSVSRFNAPVQNQEQLRCKFYPHCTNPRCTFWHPLSKGGAVSAHKWVSPHLSQQTVNVNREASVDTVKSISDASVM